MTNVSPYEQNTLPDFSRTFIHAENLTTFQDQYGRNNRIVIQTERERVEFPDSAMVTFPATERSLHFSDGRTSQYGTGNRKYRNLFVTDYSLVKTNANGTQYYTEWDEISIRKSNYFRYIGMGIQGREPTKVTIRSENMDVNQSIVLGVLHGNSNPTVSNSQAQLLFGFGSVANSGGVAKIGGGKESSGTGKQGFLSFQTNKSSSSGDYIERMRVGNDRVKVETVPFKMPVYTTTERDALSVSYWEDGDIIYNSTTNKFQGRANGAWVDLH